MLRLEPRDLAWDRALQEIPAESELDKPQILFGKLDSDALSDTPA